MDNSGPCWFCDKPGALIAPVGEDGITEDVFLCLPCKKLLQKPETAFPLLRGRLSMDKRGVPSAERDINRFMSIMSNWGSD